MKIGLKTKDYNNIVCLDIPDNMGGQEFFIHQILSCCKATTEEEVNLIVNINQTKTIKSTETI